MCYCYTTKAIQLDWNTAYVLVLNRNKPREWKITEAFSSMRHEASAKVYLFIFLINIIYDHLAKLYCCHISAILPFEIRNRSKPVAAYGLPVGGLPNNDPMFVLLFVHLISTLSYFAKISSCTFSIGYSCYYCRRIFLCSFRAFA